MKRVNVAKYDSVLTAVLLPNGDRDLGNLTSSQHMLFELAWTLDSLKSRIEGEAKSLGERFAAYAAKLAQGEASALDCPTRFSSVRDMGENVATYEAKREVFRSLFWVETGRGYAEVVAEFRAAAEEADAAVLRELRVPGSVL